MYPNSTLSSSELDASHPSIDPLDASPASSVPPDPSSRRSARSTKGVHTPFYGFYTSIREQLKHFGDPGIEAVRQELQKMIPKEVWTPILQSSLSPAERKKTITSQMFLKNSSQMVQQTK
jgi:hypothetical protein